MIDAVAAAAMPLLLMSFDEMNATTTTMNPSSAIVAIKTMVPYYSRHIRRIALPIAEISTPTPNPIANEGMSSGRKKSN
jgi:hypothetical protein